MKKLTVILLSVLMVLVLTGCKGTLTANVDPNVADTSLRNGEMKLSGKVVEVNGNTLMIEDEKGGKYVFGYSDEIMVAEDGYYVVDYTADSFMGKNVTVVASEIVLETWPMMLTQERMIIIE